MAHVSGVPLSVVCSGSVLVIASVSASPSFHGRVTLPRVDGHVGPRMDAQVVSTSVSVNAAAVDARVQGSALTCA